MADLREIVAACRGTGLTVASDVYEPDSADNGPHIVVRNEGTRSLKANGTVFARVDAWSVTLYSERYDPVSQSAVERALDSAGIVAGDASSGYDDEHRIHWCEWDFETPRQAQQGN